MHSLGRHGTDGRHDKDCLGRRDSRIRNLVWELAIDIDDELVIVSLVLAEEEEENRKKKRRFWVHNINRKSLSLGEFHT